MPRKVEDSVVVITGASSGIGRAAALAFARRGACLVLAARREGVLRDVARECEQLGGRAIHVPTDVTDEAAVEALANRAVEQFGRIDVWVNNAGVTLFARFEDAPARAYERVIETNLFGYVHGARAALRRFREQASGVLINNASINGRVGSPYASAYVASKWAVRGWSESLRQELRNADGIHVCVVLPASIDTPFFQHAANYTGRRVKPLSPVYDAGKVADAIVGLAERPRREVIVGGAGRLMSWQHTLAPALAERAFAAQVERDHFQDGGAPATEGNLFEPVGDGTGASGGWQARSTLPLRRVAVASAVLVPAVAAAAWLRR